MMFTINDNFSPLDWMHLYIDGDQSGPKYKNVDSIPSSNLAYQRSLL